MVPVGSVTREAVAFCACPLRVNGDVSIDAVTCGECTPATDLVQRGTSNVLACCGCCSACYCCIDLGEVLPSPRDGMLVGRDPCGITTASPPGCRVCTITILAWLSARLLLLSLLLMRCSR